MKSFQSLIVMLAALMLLLNISTVAGSSSTKLGNQMESQVEEIKIDNEEDRKRDLCKCVALINPLYDLLNK